MNNFIKSFDTFVNEKKKSGKTDNTDLPAEVIKTAKIIVDGIFDEASKKRIDGNIFKFKVTDTDFKLVDPEHILELDLGFGPSKKRKYDVGLKFVSAIENNNELVYMIDFKPKGLSDGLKQKEEEIMDIWEKPEVEESLPDEPFGKKSSLMDDIDPLDRKMPSFKEFGTRKKKNKGQGKELDITDLLNSEEEDEE